MTNTPWAERVTFLFAPGLDLVAKPLHVSPFMVSLQTSVYQLHSTPLTLQFLFSSILICMREAAFWSMICARCVLFSGGTLVKKGANNVNGIIYYRMQDMEAVWQMQAPAPGQELLLRIGVQHPEYGNYFQAILKAKRVTRAVNPEAFTWMMPQKVAFWIYWQV